MSLSRSAEGEVEVIALRGDLDASVAPEVRRQLEELLEEERRLLVLDLREVGFIDSSGLSVLAVAVKRVRAAGGDLALANLQPSVRSIVRLTRLDKILDIFDDRATAVASLAE